MGLPRILLVEPGPASQANLCDLLAKAGFEVFASSSDAAANRAQEVGADLALMELGAPGTDGFGLMQGMAAEGWPGKVVFLAGGEINQTKFLLEVARRLGASATLQRPFEDSELIDCVRRCLNQDVPRAVSAAA